MAATDQQQRLVPSSLIFLEEVRQSRQPPAIQMPPQLPVQWHPRATEPAEPGAQASKAPEKKKNALQKIFGIFGDKKKKEPEKPPRDKGDSP